MSLAGNLNGNPRRNERLRIGLVLPSTNAVMEPDFYRVSPPYVTFHSARIPRTTRESSVSVNEEMRRLAPSTARVLADVDPSLILFGCTAASFIGGAGGEQTIAREMEEASGVPCLSTAAAVMEALEHLGARRISLITPYIDEINQREIEFLHALGYEVAACAGMGIAQTPKMSQVTPEEIHQFAVENVDPNSDAIFISCTTFRAFEASAGIERALEIPVVTSNQASLWAIFQRLHIREPVMPGARLWSFN